ERRGMPAPEFTSVLPPVIASAPDSGVHARPSGVFATLPPLAGEPFATPAPPPASGLAAAEPRPRRRSRGLGPLLAACAALALLALAALPSLPDVIRIPLPGAWQPRVPRVEFVQHAPPAPPAAPHEPQVKLAEREPVEGVLVPPRVLPAPVE